MKLITTKIESRLTYFKTNKSHKFSYNLKSNRKSKKNKK